MATASLARKIGSDIAKLASKRGSEWYTNHMAAASRAIFDRIPMVDIVLEVRDARIPLSSGYEDFKRYGSSTMRFVVLNKADLAVDSQTEKWLKYFKKNNVGLSFGVNTNDNESVRKLLSFLKLQVKKLNEVEDVYTRTVLLVGVPNVGKSALANTLHQLSRIGLKDMGKLMNVKVSPHPGETKDIRGFKIGSFPNIYALDTPGVFPPEITNFEACSKLALTGAINDSLVVDKDLAHYFLAIVNSGNEYKKWSNEPTLSLDRANYPEMSKYLTKECFIRNNKNIRERALLYKRDFRAKKIRKALFETISSFDGNVIDNNENDSMRLIEAEMVALESVFDINAYPSEDTDNIIDSELLNFYRSGMLGRYTLDSAP